ncbi:hypothetical protein HMPREF0765_1710, partial [Sphingobacterium spiritivorum ATCC 33300]
LSAAYFLWTLQRMFFGQTRLKGGESWVSKLTDINLREQIILFPTIALALVLGIFPFLIFDKMNTSVLHFVSILHQYIG